MESELEATNSVVGLSTGNPILSFYYTSLRQDQAENSRFQMLRSKYEPNCVHLKQRASYNFKMS